MKPTNCPKCNATVDTIGAENVCREFYMWRTAMGDRPAAPPCDWAEVRREFEIPAENLPRLVAKIESLGRRAKRLGCAAPAIAIGASAQHEIKRDGEKFWVTFVTVDVFGPAPRVGDWTFQATIDHDGDENIVRCVGGRAKGEESGYPKVYRTAAPACAHCNTDRRRGETFLLKSDAGEWKQVGRTCLRDFLGHADPAGLAASAEFLAEAMEEADDCWDDGSGMGGSAGDPDIERYLGYVARAIRERGWTPRSAHSDEATADIAAGWLYGNMGCAKSRTAAKFPVPEAEDHVTAAAALEWARSLTGDSEFDSNIRACSKRVAVTHKNMGLTAYIVAGYLRAETAKYERAVSNHVGVVGQRFGAGKGKKAVPEIEVTVIKVIEIAGSYGYSYLHIMRDAAGNAITWKSSVECLKTGKQYALTGTIRAHEEYKGTKQTVLSRCVARPIGPRLGSDVERGQVRKAADGDMLVVGVKYIPCDSEGRAHYDIERVDPETGCRDGGQMTDEAIVEQYPTIVDALPEIPSVADGDVRAIGTSGATLNVGWRVPGGRFYVTLRTPDGQKIAMGAMTPREIVNYSAAA